MLIHCPREDLGPQAKRVRTQDDVETQRHEDTGARRHRNTVTEKHRYTETHRTYVETWTRDTGVRSNEDTEIKSRDSTTATDDAAAVDDDVDDDEYAIEWFESQREVEREFHPTRCLERQIQVLPSSRCVLVSWLIPVRRHLSLSLHSLSLALSLLDRFLARVPLASDCLQLLGVACLHIAAKQVEVTAPRASQLLDLCGRAFTTQQLKNLERLVLLRLKFRLLAPTAADFLSFYLSRERGEAARGRALGEAEMALSCLSEQILELSFADYAFNSFPASTLALAALEVASRLLGWSRINDGDNRRKKLPLRLSRALWLDCVGRLCLLVSLNQNILP
uniref:Cyclin O n=1 Tax=Petromyzon marinus TaxID=7757 RepID=S4R5L9_PETMA